MLSYVIGKGGNRHHGKAAMQKLHCRPGPLRRVAQPEAPRANGAKFQGKIRCHRRAALRHLALRDPLYETRSTRLLARTSRSPGPGSACRISDEAKIAERDQFTSWRDAVDANVRRLRRAAE